MHQPGKAGSRKAKLEESSQARSHSFEGNVMLHAQTKHTAMKAPKDMLQDLNQRLLPCLHCDKQLRASIETFMGVEQ